MTNENLPIERTAFDDAADEQISQCLDIEKPKSFFLFAGAGSGKTRSLITALNGIRRTHARNLALLGHRVGVITYTNAACDEIKRRIDFSPLFHVSTIHSFAWDLIRGFDRDIREWLRGNLSSEIATLNDEEAKGRPGTKASVARQSKLASKTKRLEGLDTSTSFIYNPDGDNTESNSLNHAEVIAICSAFITQKPSMRWILIGRFPFLLIDECQDTNRSLIEAFFRVEQEHGDRFAIGLFGDVMQRIYADGKEDIEGAVPEEWGKPSKTLNHRCPKRIIRLLNKVREPIDSHIQVPRSDATEGHVRLFIRSAHAERKEVEDAARARMASITDDEAWKLQDSCKILTLEHHMSAKRLGFEGLFTPLYGIDSFRTGLLDGTPAARFFIGLVLPLVEAQQESDQFSVARILRSNSPLLSARALKETSDPGALLRQAKLGVEAVCSLWEDGEPTCGDVLASIARHELLEIPASLEPIVDILQTGEGSAEDESDDPLAPETQALLSMMEAPFSELKRYRDYVSGTAPFDTHQGVKGLEFKRVMVIMDDTEARGFMFGYGKLLGEKAPSETDLRRIREGRDSSIDRTRRLFYVTTSRATESLALVAYSENPGAVKEHVVNSGWFTEDEIEAGK